MVRHPSSLLRQERTTCTTMVTRLARARPAWRGIGTPVEATTTVLRRKRTCRQVRRSTHRTPTVPFLHHLSLMPTDQVSPTSSSQPTRRVRVRTDNRQRKDRVSNHSRMVTEDRCQIHTVARTAMDSFRRLLRSTKSQVSSPTSQAKIQASNSSSSTRTTRRCILDTVRPLHLKRHHTTSRMASSRAAPPTGSHRPTVQATTAIRRMPAAIARPSRIQPISHTHKPVRSTLRLPVKVR